MWLMAIFLKTGVRAETGSSPVRTSPSIQTDPLPTCRSGVYHPSNHQTRSVTLPPRGTHQPGTHFLYNNWDFNALGTILERHTSKGMFNDFADTIATPS